MKNIIKYELIQLFRDKKTIFFIFILPLIIFPLLNGGLSFLTKSKIKEIMDEKITILVERNLNGVERKKQLPSDFFEILNKDYNISSEFITPSVLENDTSSVILDSLLSIYPAIIKINPITKSLSDSIITKEYRNIPQVTVLYSSKKEKKSIEFSKVIKSLKKMKKEFRNLRYLEIGIEDYPDLIKVKKQNIASYEKSENFKFAKMLPITLVLILFFGTYAIANYIILGEKDNKTLETLLSSGASRKTIIFGKFLVIFSAGFIMSILEMVSFYLYAVIGDFSDFKIFFSPMQVLLLFLAIIALTILVASIGINISTRLKSTTIGQAVMTPLMILFLLLGFVGTFDGIVIEKGLLFIPVMNIAGIIKSIILDEQGILLNIIFVISISTVYTYLIMRDSVKILNGEKILHQDNDSGFLGSKLNLKSQNIDKSNFVIVSFLILIVVYMLLGGYLQGKDIVSGLVFSQIIILGIAAVVILKLANFKVIESFRFNKFQFKYLIFAIIIGLFARFPISYIIEGFKYFFPFPNLLTEGNPIATSALADLNIYYYIGIVAVLPAIFEELVFRGSLLPLLQADKKRSDLRNAIIIGILFGAMHLNAYTFLETGLLGVVLAMITIKSGSIFPAMILHFVNNASSILLMEMMKEENIEKYSSFIDFFENEKYVGFIAGAVAVYILSLFFVKKKGEAITD